MIPFNTIQKIAIFRRNGLGDTLCSIPLILRCKELMPQAKITLFLEKAGYCLAPYLKGPDEIALIPPSSNKYLEILKLAWQRGFEKFDLAISAKTSPMKLMNFSLYLTRASHRAAYITTHKWHEKLITHPRAHIPENLSHQALQAIHLIDPEMMELPRRLHPTLQGIEKKKLFAEKALFISLSNNRIGSTLSLERTASVLNTLYQFRSFAVAISCMELDFLKAKKMSSLLNMPNQIFATKQFADFLTVLHSADIIFACDGGIVHLAAALQKPSLFLFGGTKVEQWGPLCKEALTIAYPGHVMDIPETQIVYHLQRLLENVL